MGDLAGALARLEEIGGLIQAEAAAAEQLGHLTAPVVDALHATGLIGAVVPGELGGLGLTFPEAIELWRAAARHDASTGWTLAILCNGGIVGRQLDPAVFAALAAGGPPSVAGSLNPLSARADPVDGGFRFTGTIPYASGCHHARWLLVTAWVHRDGARSFVDGIPEFVAGIAPIDVATVHPTWHPTGMRATGSDDCTVEDLVLPSEWTFSWSDPVSRWTGDTWSAIPLMVQIGPNLASTAVGAARAARDAFVDLSGAKRPVGTAQVLADRAYAHVAVGHAEGLLLAAEDTLAAVAADVWAQGEAGRPFTFADRARMRARTVTATRLACDAVDLLHDAAGMTSTAQGNVIERVWRDVHTASQHINLNVARDETIGRIVLGRDPGTPVI